MTHVIEELEGQFSKALGIKRENWNSDTIRAFQDKIDLSSAPGHECLAEFRYGQLPVIEAGYQMFRFPAISKKWRGGSAVLPGLIYDRNAVFSVRAGADDEVEYIMHILNIWPQTLLRLRRKPPAASVSRSCCARSIA